MGRARSFCPLRTAGERSSLGSVPALGPALQAGLLRAGGAAVACRTVRSHNSAQNIEGLSHGESHQRLEKVVPVRSELPSAVGEQKANAGCEM